jgi:protein-disulfide isomerase
MHDLLFTNQKALKMTDLISYAKTLGLDIKKFQKSLDSREFQKQVETDMAFGKMLRVTATPTFFVNGNKITGAKAYPEFKNMIETLLAGKELPKVQEPNKETPAALVTDLKPDLSGTLNAKGVETAPVTIVEYSDFQCPFCGRVVPSLDKLFKAYPDKIRIIFKQYPLSFHANARPAAKAALAAGRQGKFWEMHAKIFDGAGEIDKAEQNELRGLVEKYSQQIGLDQKRFDQCLDSGVKQEIIQKNMAEGRNYRISGTPTVLFNGKKILTGLHLESPEPTIQIIKSLLNKENGK